MKLITEDFEELFKDYPLYSQEKEKDSPAIVKSAIAGRKGLRAAEPQYIMKID